MRQPIATSEAPSPAGSYSQGMAACGLVFLAGQTPRRPDGTRISDAPFDEQARQTLQNLGAVANAAGACLDDAVMVTVFLSDPQDASSFDAVWQEFFAAPFPARAIVQSDLPGYALEVTAILAPTSEPAGLDSRARVL